MINKKFLENNKLLHKQETLLYACIQTPTVGVGNRGSEGSKILQVWQTWEVWELIKFLPWDCLMLAEMEEVPSTSCVSSGVVQN